MSTSSTSLRRGLPRVPGGEPWPPAGTAPVSGDAALADSAAFTRPDVSVPESSDPQSATSERSGAVAPAVAPASIAVPADAAVPAEAVPVRRGLPRVPGGEPWPSAEFVAFTRPDVSVPEGPDPQLATSERSETVASVSATPPVGSAVEGNVGDAASAGAVAPASIAVPADAAVPAEAVPVRRGLPRVPGGEPWPSAEFVAFTRPDVSVPEGPDPQLATSERPGTVGGDVATRIQTPLAFTRTVFPGAAARAWDVERATRERAPAAPEPARIGPFTRAQWAGTAVVGVLGVVVALGLLVALTRWLLSFGPFQEFVATYPGEYHLPEGAPVGFPAWLGWQHFFNVFLMVLIIRSGLQVRNDKRPSAFWSPRRQPNRKISLSLWFHQSLDILWIVNGAVFIVLLFVTGQWMRIVPTSWEVFPNALSAALQYLSLDWPIENGWVNYNGLQQLAYFSVVFLAAPLAIVTGVRMSGVWPKNAKMLNRIYPVEVARAVHFPVMLFFVAFIIVHVALVFATGALRNLNHMYAAQGSVDPTAYADNWTGFWIFVASIVVIAVAWVAARPLVLAPIARLFGTVKGR